MAVLIINNDVCIYSCRKFQIIILTIRRTRVNEILKCFIQCRSSLNLRFVTIRVAHLRSIFSLILSFRFLVLRLTLSLFFCFLFSLLILWFTFSLRVLLRWLCYLLALLLLLLLAPLIEFLSESKAVLKGLKGICFSQENFLIISKRNILVVADLVLKVDAVSKIQIFQLTVSNGEEVFVVEHLVTTVEGLTKTTVATLHQFLNTNVLNDIHELHRDLTEKSKVIRSVKSMTDLMSNQKVLDHVIGPPHRQRQDTGLYVELSSLNVAMLNDQVLGGKAASKVFLDGMHGFLLTAHSIRPPTLVRGLHVTLFKVAQCLSTRSHRLRF